MRSENVMERASSIRLSGEPWQNAVQRAGAQIRYENQQGAGTGCRKKNSYPKDSRGTPNCYVSKKGRCALSSHARGNKPAEGWEGRAADGYVESLNRWHSQAKGLAAYQKENAEKVALQREAFGVASKVHTGKGSRALRNAEIAKAMEDPVAYLAEQGIEVEVQEGGAKGRKKSKKAAVAAAPKRRGRKKGVKVGAPHTVNCLYNPDTARCTLSCEGRRKSNARRAAVRGTRSGEGNKNEWNTFLKAYSQRPANKGKPLSEYVSAAAAEYRSA